MKKILISILIVIAIVSVIVFEIKNSKEEVRVNTAVERKAYPTIDYDTGAFNLYFFDDKSLKTVVWPAIEGGVRPTGFVTDLYSTVYTVGNLLKVVDHTSLKTKTLFTAKDNQVIFIPAGMSPNSEFIIFSIGTIPERNSGYDDGDTGFVKVESKVFNLKTGEVRDMPENIVRIDSFVDDTHVVIANTSTSSPARYAILNLNTFTVDTKAFDEKFGFVSSEIRNSMPWFSFSEDRTKVLFSTIVETDNETRSAVRVILGDLTLKKYIVVNPIGTFVNKASVSPDGKKVVYTIQDTLVKGIPTTRTVLYDTFTQKTTELNSKGLPSRWIDNTSLVLDVYDYATTNKSSVLVNTETGESEEMVGVKW